MKLRSILGFIYVISVSCYFGTCASWSYTPPNGPANWTKTDPVCGGLYQSPINIDSANAVVDDNLGIFSKSIFSSPPSAMKIINNGHSLQVDMTGSWTISDKALLPGNYKAVQFHMHWGANSTTGGSEHTLDGVREFGELHFVHYNTKYQNIGAAIKELDGLAVLGFFIKPDYPQDNLEFDRLLEPVRNNMVRYPTNSTTIDPFAVETFLPCDLSAYYRYFGSLTTPGCFESVTWTVFKDPIRISAKQANLLSHLHSSFPEIALPKIIKNNYRPVQSLNGRKVYKPAPYGHGAFSTSQAA